MRRRLPTPDYALGILLLILSALPVYASPTAEEIEKAYNTGQEYWDKGDPVSAMRPLKIAADGGHPKAQALFAVILDAADDDVDAANYYRKSADQGNPDGMFGLATFMVSGDGDTKIDIAAAKALYLKAAELDHTSSVSVVIMGLVNGKMGFNATERNGPSALKWYTKGAEMGLTVAIEQLSIAHREGKYGLPVNIEEADRLQAKLYEIMGIDPTKLKKRRQRR